MIGSYEDDTHICLKCRLTIIGLENYVNHRKSNCSKTVNVVDIPESPLPSQLLPQHESFTLKADDFFSSLELQSSTKKTPLPSTSGKTFSGILTRSKTSAVIQSSNKEGGCEVQQSKSGKNAWIGGHQLKELGCGDNQTKLIKAVDNLSRNSCLKKDDTPEIRVYNETDDDSEDYDSEDDEYDDDDEVPPRNFTGGKWKPCSPISEWSEPPPNYTGGKWKPSKQTRLLLSPPQSHTKGKWTVESSMQNLKEQYDAIPSPSFTGSKWSASKARNEYGDVPPPSHTKGKWKPTNFKEKLGQSSRWESGDSGDQFPPPGHTKGKWKPVANEKKAPEEKLDDKLNIKYEDRRKITEDSSPPFRKYNGSVQYWCGPCNRRLASKIVYDRHLKSELHFKRTLHDQEFDDSSHLNTNLDKATKKTAIRKPVEYWSHTATENNKDTMKNTTQTAKRIRKKKYVKCEVCRSRVTSQMMGKHLISHYHCRKGDISLPEAKQMVLDNIYNIVLQSPYNCAICRFYCNTHEHFLDHWNTDGHKKTINNRPGYIWCGFCKFSCADNDAMREHLTSPEHIEVISVINRSVPIIIKKINPISCESCSKLFILNIQLRKHCEIENHKCSGTASNEYQGKNNCTLCKKVYHSAIALQRHIRKHHGAKTYFCSICDLKFDDSKSISEHRNSEEHRDKCAERNKKLGPKQCEYCDLPFNNFRLYKKHLQEVHPDKTHNCPHCGKKFTVPQQVTVHIRSKSCTFMQEKKSNSCDKCPYSTESVSDLIYHKALHATPILITTKKSLKQQNRYKCPLCHKLFTKHSLKFHIKNHMNEKAYKCTYCDVKFARKNNWKVHMKNHSGVKPKGKARVSTGIHQCTVCQASFKQKSILNNHMIIHEGKKFKCSEPDCYHLARNAADLKIHKETHSTERNYKCASCDYLGKTKPLLKRHELTHENVKKYKCSKCNFTARLAFHLKRHELVHSGAKPYACPHCEYKCNTIENLRKHVLSTNKHPGKCLYECKFCEDDQFQTNFAKDFRVHLIGEHGDVFGSGSEGTSYIAGIYDSVDVNAAAAPAATVVAAAVAAATGKQTETIGSKANSGMMPLELTETTTDSNMDNNVLITTQPPYSNKGEDLFPMYMSSKDEVTCVDKDTWSIVASFDVEESAALVSFNGEEEAFFEEDFINP